MTATMSWELDREHEEFRASVRSFVDRQVRPLVEESEEAGRPPAALLKEMGSAGLLGLAVPESCGGGAGDTLAIVLLSEELARASGGAALSVDLEAARLLTYRAAARLDSGHPEAATSVAMAKYHAAIAANHIVDECVQLFGGSGFLEETPVARHYRDVRVLRIGGGTDEIQLEILAKGLGG